MNASKINYLQAMGIQAWELRQASNLDQTRTETAFGVGNMHADLMIIGEGPGVDEDPQGESFVGRSGQLLTAMLEAIGIERKAVYIANIVNRAEPTPEDCMLFLEKQIALLQPKLLLAVGEIAARALLKSDAPLSELRGKIHMFGTELIPLVVTYHPAHLLRHPVDKRATFEDLQMASRMLETLDERVMAEYIN
jgi:uracil-DNA glycosylase family 4